MEYLKYFSMEFIYILAEMAQYLMFGFVIAGLMHLCIPRHRIRKYMGHNDFRSVLNASLFGVPLPLCSCGVIPTGISFYKYGASKDSTCYLFRSSTCR